MGGSPGLPRLHASPSNLNLTQTHGLRSLRDGFEFTERLPRPWPIRQPSSWLDRRRSHARIERPFRDGPSNTPKVGEELAPAISKRKLLICLTKGSSSDR